MRETLKLLRTASNVLLPVTLLICGGCATTGSAPTGTATEPVPPEDVPSGYTAAECAYEPKSGSGASMRDLQSAARQSRRVLCKHPDTVEQFPLGTVSQ